MFHFGLVVTSLFIIYALTQMSFSGVPQAIASIEIKWLAPVVLGQLGHYFFRALRIGKILDPIKVVSLKDLFSINSIGFMAVVLLPAHTGAILRAYLISKKENISTSSTMGVIVVEKMLDAISAVGLLFFVFLIASPTKITPDTWQVLKEIGILLIVLALAAVFIICICVLKNHLVKNVLVRSITRFSKKGSMKFEKYFESFASGLSVIRDARQIAIITGCSFLVWVATITYYYCILKMLGVPVSLEVASMVTLMLVISAAIPASPGLIGTFHAAVVFALMAYGMTQEYALGIAVMHHLIVFSSIVVLGLYFLWKEKMAFSEIKNL